MRIEAERVIDEFLDDGEESEEKTDLPERTAVILFADVVASTALTERMGADAFRAGVRALDKALRSIIGEFGGSPGEGKMHGHGFIAVFTSACPAIDAALKCALAGNIAGLPLLVGVHAGDVNREGDNFYGGAVDIAALISAESEAGEVLVSDTVRSLAGTSVGVAFEDLGEHELKEIEEPRRLYLVRGAV